MYGVRRPCASCGAGGGNFNYTQSNWNYNRINNYSPSTTLYNFNNYRYSSPMRTSSNYSYNQNNSLSPRPFTSYQNRFNTGNNYHSVIGKLCCLVKNQKTKAGRRSEGRVRYDQIRKYY